ncbi:MAG: hypothetical protein HOC71_13465 [Candidatus Latescibacteria bacterium]|jgi:tetratricopeptide (TPR) repeat protein|nr:hypothetical protein [Candidatus Latescibacterota bacterium]
MTPQTTTIKKFPLLLLTAAFVFCISFRVEAFVFDEVRDIFTKYGDAVIKGNVKEALSIFESSDSKTKNIQKKLIDNNAVSVSDYYTHIDYGADDTFSFKHKYQIGGMVVFIDSNSRPIDGFQFLAGQRKKDNGWDIKTREITNDKTRAAYYNACASYYKSKDLFEQQKAMYDKIIRDYSKVREAVPNAYISKGNIPFDRAEAKMRETKAERAPELLKPLYKEALESFLKVLTQKGIQQSLDVRTKYRIGSCYYRLGNNGEAKKYLQEVAAINTMFERSNRGTIQEISKEFLEKIEAGK